MPAMKVSNAEFLRIVKRVSAAGGGIAEIAAESQLDKKSVSVKLSTLRKKFKGKGIDPALIPTFQRGRTTESVDDLVEILNEDTESDGDDSDNS